VGAAGSCHHHRLQQLAVALDVQHPPRRRALREKGGEGYGRVLRGVGHTAGPLGVAAEAMGWGGAASTEAKGEEEQRPVGRGRRKGGDFRTFGTGSVSLRPLSIFFGGSIFGLSRVWCEIP